MIGAWLLALSLKVAHAGPESDLRALAGVSAGYAEALSAAVNNPTLSDAALAQLAESADWRVRQQAEVVLVWREAPVTAEAIHTAEPRLTRAGTLRLQDPSLDSPKAAPVLVDRLLHEPDPLRRAALADAVSRQAAVDPVVLSGLIGAEPDAAVRAQLVWGWREHADAEAALVGLRVGLRDPDPGVRAQAAAAAGYRDNGADLADDLVKLLDDSAPEVRALAARSLGWLRVDSASQPLVKLLDESSSDVRLAALHALERIDREAAAALPELAPLARDPDPRVVRAAADLAR